MIGYMRGTVDRRPGRRTLEQEDEQRPGELAQTLFTDVAILTGSSLAPFARERLCLWCMTTNLAVGVSCGAGLDALHDRVLEDPVTLFEPRDPG